MDAQSAASRLAAFPPVERARQLLPVVEILLPAWDTFAAMTNLDEITVTEPDLRLVAGPRIVALSENVPLESSSPTTLSDALSTVQELVTSDRGWAEALGPVVHHLV